MSKLPKRMRAPQVPPRTNGKVGIGTGIEWIIDAFDCDVEFLCDPSLIKGICDQVIEELQLKVLGDPQVHQFDDPGGVTALYMLSESHLACHTYPEYQLATFNLYCCRARPAWEWSSRLRSRLGAGDVEINQVARGLRTDDPNRLGLGRLESVGSEVRR